MDAAIFSKWIVDDMDGSRQVWIGHASEEGLVSMHQSQLRVLVPSFVLGTRPAIQKLTDSSISACCEDNDLLGLTSLVRLLFSDLAVVELGEALLVRPYLDFAFRFSSLLGLVGVVVLENLRLQSPEDNLMVFASSTDEACIVFHPND